MKILLILLALILTGSTGAQTKTLRWSTEMCEYSGTYDSRKYTEKQLLDTLKLVNTAGILFSNYPNVWKWEDIDRLDVAALDEEYRKKSAELKALDVVAEPYWQQAKAAKITHLDQEYRFYRIKTLAYRTPEVLRDYPAAQVCTEKYAEPLIRRDDSLLKVWLEVNMRSRANNVDPERLKLRYEQQMASPDRLKYAIVEVMGFGWGNCVNEFIERDDAASDGRHLEQFKKLFRRVREVECEEP